MAVGYHSPGLQWPRVTVVYRVTVALGISGRGDSGCGCQWPRVWVSAGESGRGWQWPRVIVAASLSGCRWQ